jgi:hypothetical protein
MSTALALPTRRSAVLAESRGIVVIAFIYAALTAAVIYPLALILYQAFVRDGGVMPTSSTKRRKFAPPLRAKLVLGVPGRVHTLSTLMFRYINDYPPDYATAEIIGTVLLVFTVVFTFLQIAPWPPLHDSDWQRLPARTIDLGRWRWLAPASTSLTSCSSWSLSSR